MYAIRTAAVLNLTFTEIAFSFITSIEEARAFTAFIMYETDNVSALIIFAGILASEDIEPTEWKATF